MIFDIELLVYFGNCSTPINITIYGKILNRDKCKTFFGYIYRSYPLPKEETSKFC